MSLIQIPKILAILLNVQYEMSLDMKSNFEKKNAENLFFPKKFIFDTHWKDSVGTTIVLRVKYITIHPSHSHVAYQIWLTVTI